MRCGGLASSNHFIVLAWQEATQIVQVLKGQVKPVVCAVFFVVKLDAAGILNGGGYVDRIDLPVKAGEKGIRGIAAGSINDGVYVSGFYIKIDLILRNLNQLEIFFSHRKLNGKPT